MNIRAVSWLGVVLVVVGLLGAKISREGLKFDTNILTLLPATEQDAAVEHAVNQFSEDMGRRVIFLFSSPHASQARAAADHLVAECEGGESFLHITGKREVDTGRNFYEFYSPHAGSLLDEETVERLQSDEGVSVFLTQSIELLYSPLGASLSPALADDPLLLFPQWIQQQMSALGNGGINEGYVEVSQEGQTHVLVDGVLAHSPFDRRGQKQGIEVIESALSAVAAAFPEVAVRKTGALFYAHAGSESAEREIQTIGLGSSLGILFLVLFTFRSFRYIGISFLPIAVGFLFAVTATQYWFPRVHLITLGFGASLIGVCIDYAFHFFADCTGEDGRIDGRKVLHAIFPGVTLGMITSLMAYAGLYVAPFPGLQQMAVFSSVGLLGAFGTVIAWFPFFLHEKPRAKSPRVWMGLVRGVLRSWERLLPKAWFPWVLGGVSLAMMAGLIHLQPNDDIRQLQEMPAHLVEEEREIEQILGRGAMGGFLLVKGESPNQVLTIEEKLRTALEGWKGEGHLLEFQSLSRWIPSEQKQQASREALRKLVESHSETLQSHFAAYGFPDTALASLKKQLASDGWINVEDWLVHSVSEPFRHLWIGEVDKAWFSLVLLEGVKNVDVIRGIESVSGVSYVNKVEDITDIFRRYRELASWLILGVYVVIGLLLGFRYGVRKGLRVFLPPCLAAGWTLGLLGYLGQPLTLFHVLGLLLVLGIGIDYTLFFAEARSAASKILLAIFLSSCTTLLAFGLLALSQTAALRNFGLTILIGIAFALIFAPIATNQNEPSTR